MQILSKDETKLEELIGAECVFNNNNVIIVAIKERALRQACRDLLKSGEVGFFGFHHEEKLSSVKNYTTTKELNDYTIYQFNIYER